MVETQISSKYSPDNAAGRYGYPVYDITEQDKDTVMRNVLDITRKYRKAWNGFKSETA